MIRRTLGWKSVGHAGTLDPSATGVLIVLCGDATRRTDEFMQLPKEYVARIRFGFTTTTDDFEGEVIESRPLEDWPREKIIGVLKNYVGTVSQVPPAVSAIKVAGRRSYRMARAGQRTPLEPRVVQIHELQLLSDASPEITILLRCSRGTYVRALARDMGEQLGFGGTLAALTRTAIGPYRHDHALALNDIFFRRSEFSGK
jgi:tRNA pseudouridine55 synthase